MSQIRFLEYKTILLKLKKGGVFFYLKNYYKRLLKIITPKYQKMFIFEMDLADFSEKVNNKKNITVEIAKNITEINSFIKERNDWYYDYAKSLFKKGNLCFVGKINNKVVSCVWTSFNEVYLSDVEYLLHVDKDTVPLIDGYTLPEYRNMGIYKIVWNNCIKYFQGKPVYTKMYGFVTHSDLRSLSVHKKLKLKLIVMEISLLRIFGFRKHFIKHYKRK